MGFGGEVFNRLLWSLVKRSCIFGNQQRCCPLNDCEDELGVAVLLFVLKLFMLLVDVELVEIKFDGADGGDNDRDGDGDGATFILFVSLGYIRR